MTKTLIAASLIAAGLTSSAFASDTFTAPNASFKPAAQVQTINQASQAYAYAPANDQQNPNRVEVSAVSSR